MPRRIVVVPSIMSAVFGRLAEEVRAVDAADSVAVGGTGILAVTGFDYVDTSGEAHDQRKDLRHR